MQNIRGVAAAKKRNGPPSAASARNAGAVSKVGPADAA